MAEEAEGPGPIIRGALVLALLWPLCVLPCAGSGMVFDSLVAPLVTIALAVLVCLTNVVLGLVGLVRRAWVLGSLVIAVNLLAALGTVVGGFVLFEMIGRGLAIAMSPR